jgi:predicted esterase
MSQGGVMALYYALKAPYELGGAIALSAYVIPDVTFMTNLGKVPLLLVHGSKDEVIRESEAKTSYSRLLSTPLVDYHSI